jgi:transcriptional regulator NrdR family protein
MKCPKCGADTNVLETRWMPVMFQKAGYNRRRRECKECGLRIKTEEIYIRPLNDRREYNGDDCDY